jgi:hypothetical protein
MSQDFKSLYDAAMAAGAQAAAAANVRPMTVRAEDIQVNGVPIGAPGQVWHEPEGVCGFAWVVVKPGTSPFARWLKAQGHASKHYAGGVSIWIGDYNQSMQRKEAHAEAMVKVFAAADIQCYADSRMD